MSDDKRDKNPPENRPDDEQQDVSRREVVKQGFFAGAGFVVVDGWRKPLVDRIPGHSIQSDSSVGPVTTTTTTTATPTTAAPTTAAPTTAAPTTAAPTTAAPTTAAPTTAAPTTAAPTTASPTTASPTTASPTTASPTMVVPAVPVAGLTALGGALTAGGAYLASRSKPAPTAASPTPSPTPAGRDAGASQDLAAAFDGIALESKPWRAPGCAIDEVDGELILSVPDSDPLLVNRTGALVWSLCDGKSTVGEITARLEEAYPEASDRIASDVLATLGRLLTAKALVVA